MTTSSVDEPADLADEPRFFHEVPVRPALLQPHESVALSLPLTSGPTCAPTLVQAFLVALARETMLRGQGSATPSTSPAPLRCK